ncbi:hypothetical protein GCM10011507_20360 [Edaphobacter acidisoli]|uniref:histidine kinase n=1 Tax=Edaphobacter acidisoli TaxID=2040573 RepID=A0A916W5V9_9BACT|nr:HAMP domain-containing sensor histidine kinase [Edaphobacter acidisoli]GGA68823.1 hypothetical protein GCM10011507_20360 [Edaphobacter acidisoli]
MWASPYLEAWPAAVRWLWPGAVACLAGSAWIARRKAGVQDARQRQKTRLHEELEAYTRLDTRIPDEGEMRGLAHRVCRMVAEKSAFSRAAMLVRGATGRLQTEDSKGLDEQTAQALDAWCESLMEVERGQTANHGTYEFGMRITPNSFAIVLGKGAEDTGCGRAVFTPMWGSSGRILGALVVCADGLLSVRRSAVVEAMANIEALAAKLARAIENAALAERLLKAEKLAGLGLLAGGVAHALGNPLTSVLGFAELIADTTQEPRVREDAQMIAREARRMRETVDSLSNYWQPIAGGDELVEIPSLLDELSVVCSEKLERRGIRLVVETADAVPIIRGNKERLRQVMEHLLNNAAQAVGKAMELGVASPLDDDSEAHLIRVTVNCDERTLHLIISDTGPGFREPARVFDPFYTGADVEAGEGAKIGLSLCHGIVREHGGEISAFNLHPHGAAVMVELPVGSASHPAREVA